MPELINNALARLETLLRYVAPGFVLLLLLMLLDPPLRTKALNGNIPAWMVVLSAALAGVGLYSVHTGVILRLVFWRAVVALLIKCSPWLQPSDRSKSAREVMFHLDTERWSRRASADREVVIIQGELDRWASLVNFLYCSGYALIVAPLIALERGSTSESHYWLVCLLGGLLLLVFACISNYGMTDRALWAATKYPGGKTSDGSK